MDDASAKVDHNHQGYSILNNVCATGSSKSMCDIANIYHRLCVVGYDGYNCY